MPLGYPSPLPPSLFYRLRGVVKNNIDKNMADKKKKKKEIVNDKTKRKTYDCSL